ncbi:MAG TPA: ATP-binding protein [Bryobacteraceae bacterium]|nr:ATP-binding protein [Bryobacteraceae bacterium]
MTATSALEVRILIVAPRGRDARLIATTLSEDGLSPATCADTEALVARMAEGAAAAIIAEEALSAAGLDTIRRFLESQPPWSDIPIVVLTHSGRASLATMRRAKELEVLGNVTYLERPARPDTLRSSMRAALRARLRQYELRHRQEVLVRVNADLERFAYSASHDLQEPIRNVAIYTEILTMRYGSMLDEAGLEFLGNVRAGAVRMQMLVHDLLTYTQAASIADEEPEPSDAEAVLKTTLENLKASVPDGGTITHDPLPTIRMGAVHLQQLFQNLIGNAIKYRSQAPLRIHIGVEKVDGLWRFAVEDNGIGIAAEYTKQIFGIFKRLHTQQKYPGTGIGLAICQRIAERYGGKIWVESELDRGSRFIFTVPV